MSKCRYCGGEDDVDHPWPESAPDFSGCVRELRRQIDELRERLDDNGIYADGKGRDS